MPVPEPRPTSASFAASPLSATVVRQLRVVGLLEGASFLVLLAIAMPLKYLGGMPLVVRYVGMAHGVLFLLYVAAGVHAGYALKWPLRRTLLVLAAAILPAGPFLIDAWLRRQAAPETSAQFLDKRRSPG
jgi:integral membrane protein